MKTELAWAAGFLEGEGYIGATESSNGTRQFRSPRLVVSIHQVDIRSLERFKAAVEVGNIAGPYWYGDDRRQPYWKYSAEARRAEMVVDLLLPIMGDSMKADQARMALATMEEYRSRTECRKGHFDMRQTKSGKPYCASCKSEAALLRWERAKTR